MASKKELESFIKDIIPLLSGLDEVKEKYSALLNEYRFGKRILTEEDRNEAAKKMIEKYSNL